MKDIDKVLFDALSPKITPDDKLNQKIIGITKEDQIMNMRDIKKKRFPMVAALTTAIIVASSSTAFAAIHYMTSKQVAHEIGDEKLEAAFESKDAVSLNETQEIDGYTVNLIGMVSGKDLSDSKVESDGEFRDDRTYVVTAIQKTNGDKLGDDPFFASPLVNGYDQNELNIATLLGGYTAFYSEDNSTYYEIIDMDNIEPFADHTIYLAVQSGHFFDEDADGDPAYNYNESTGEYSANKSFDGVNALFTLPIDASKADEAKAAEIIQEINNTDNNEAEETDVNTDADKFMDKLTPENIDDYATPVESTKQVITPDENGKVSWSYEMSDTQSEGYNVMSDLFPDNRPGMSKAFGFASSDDLEDLQIMTYTLNEDGTVTFEVYVPKNIK